MVKMRRFAIGVILLATAAGSFMGVRYLVNSDEAAADIPTLSSGEILIDPPGERFAGELLGIYIAPSRSDIPARFTKAFDDACAPDFFQHQVPESEAGVLSLDLSLPDKFVLQENSLDTGVIACGDVVITARKQYIFTTADGIRAEAIVGRGIFRYDIFDVPPERVTTLTIGGREAVVIEPRHYERAPDGLFSISAVYFPETFGTTFIRAFEMPQDDLLALAEFVAAATN